MEYDRLTAKNSELQSELNKAAEALKLSNQERDSLLSKLEQEEKSKQAMSSELTQVVYCPFLHLT